MRALILNGSLRDGESLEELDRLAGELLSKAGYGVQRVLLYENQVRDCLGCFGCWIKTPGICVIDDYGRALTKTIINSDIVVYLTPVTFGGYSSELKKAVDRTIPLLLPFFRRFNGEIHHIQRYKSFPKVIVLGKMIDEDPASKETFIKLIKRNALNWYNTYTGLVIETALEDEAAASIKDIFRTVGVGQC